MTTIGPNAEDAVSIPSEPKQEGKATAPTVITLDALCLEMKVTPRDARMMLRLAAKQKAQFPNLGKEHVARQPWAWAPGSKALTEARKALAQPPAE